MVERREPESCRFYAVCIDLWGICVIWLWGLRIKRFARRWRGSKVGGRDWRLEIVFSVERETADL